MQRRALVSEEDYLWMCEFVCLVRQLALLPPTNIYTLPLRQARKGSHVLVENVL